MAKKSNYLDMIKAARSSPVGSPLMISPAFAKASLGLVRPTTEPEIDASLVELQRVADEARKAREARAYYFRKRIQWARERFSAGHYLDRILAVASVLELDPELLTILEATKRIQENSCKQEWTEALVLSVSRTALYKAVSDVGLSPEDLRPLAWAVTFDALQESDLGGLRQDKIDAMMGKEREDQ
jgi:hypothetical protein